MKNILGGEVSYVRLPPEDNYEGFVTDMFAPEYFTVVTLRVKKYLLDEMRENFGDYASILHDEDADYVRIRVRVGSMVTVWSLFRLQKNELSIWKKSVKCSELILNLLSNSFVTALSATHKQLLCNPIINDLTVSCHCSRINRF